jgi:hypothetical protein
MGKTLFHKNFNQYESLSYSTKAAKFIVFFSFEILEKKTPLQMFIIQRVNIIFACGLQHLEDQLIVYQCRHI